MTGHPERHTSSFLSTFHLPACLRYSFDTTTGLEKSLALASWERPFWFHGLGLVQPENIRINTGEIATLESFSFVWNLHLRDTWHVLTCVSNFNYSSEVAQKQFKESLEASLSDSSFSSSSSSSSSSSKHLNINIYPGNLHGFLSSTPNQ